MDYNFGYDSNGCEIEESIVEELARIANETLEEHSPFNVAIDRESFKEGFYFTGTAFGADLHYNMCAAISTDTFDMSEYINPDFTGEMSDYSMNSENAYATIDVYFAVHNDELTVTAIEADCFTCMSAGRYNYDDTETKQFFSKYNKDKLCAGLIKSLEISAREVHAVVSNL